jgi:Lon protease-like protein
MLPRSLPLFPLPNVVLFPGVYLPLHIFEPRYRAMTRHALEGDRMIGMVLLKPGWDEDYDGTPPVFEVGCAGLITHVETLADGRYNLVLQGVDRFRLDSEDQSLSFRQGAVARLEESPLDAAAQQELRRLRQQLESLLLPTVARDGDLAIPAAMPDGDLIHALAQHLDLEPMEKQALLELDGLVSRGRALTELLEMKALTARTGGSAFNH